MICRPNRTPLSSGNRSYVLASHAFIRVCKDFSFCWLQIGYILRIGYRSHEYVQIGGDLRLLAWVKVAVGVHGDLHLFVSQSVGNQKWREAHLNEKRGVRMTGSVGKLNFFELSRRIAAKKGQSKTLCLGECTNKQKHGMYIPVYCLPLRLKLYFPHLFFGTIQCYPID